MHCRTRLQRLEQRLRHDRPVHFTSRVCVPADVPHKAWHQWLTEQPCACGVVSRPKQRVGLLLPTKC
jgi:hypothetical protein